MANDAMDAFVWSDMALTRLILDNVKRQSDGSCSRPLRACIRLYRMVSSILRGENPNLYEIVRETSYRMHARGEGVHRERKHGEQNDFL